MSPDNALTQLKDLIPQGTDLLSCLDKFISFYETTYIEGCDKDKEDDMLLFQWGGPYSWDKNYSINLTRQFCFNDEDGEYIGMKHLQMNCKYDPELVNIEGGNFWFDGGNINTFRELVFNSEIVKAALKLKMQSLEFELGDV